MATHSTYPLRVPPSLMDDLRAAAERDGVSLNGFIVQAVAEKVAHLRARGLVHELTPEEQSTYLDTRAKRLEPGRLTQILEQAGTTSQVLPGDELPAGWL